MSSKELEKKDEKKSEEKNETKEKEKEFVALDAADIQLMKSYVSFDVLCFLHDLLCCCERDWDRTLLKLKKQKVTSINL
jgi:hypothetical protein